MNRRGFLAAGSVPIATALDPLLAQRCFLTQGAQMTPSAGRGQRAVSPWDLVNQRTASDVRISPDGAQVAFYPAWLGPPVSTGSGDPFANALPILPLGAYAQATYGAIPINSGWLVLQNPNANPVDVAIENPVPAQLRIPAGGYSYQNLATLGLQLEIGWRVLASAPIRMLTLTAYNDVYGQPPALIITASPLIPLNLGPLIVGPERYQDFGLQGGHDDPDLEAARGFGLLLQNVCANR